MGSVLETGERVFRYAGRMVTDVTSVGGSDFYRVAASGSEAPNEPERHYGEFGLRTAGAVWEIGLWYSFESSRDDWVRLPDLELAEALAESGSPVVTSEPRSLVFEELRDSLKQLFSSGKKASSRTARLGAKGRGSEESGLSELGRRLVAIRRRIKASGVPLLDWDDFDREMAARRGLADEETKG